MDDPDFAGLFRTAAAELTRLGVPDPESEARFLFRELFGLQPVDLALRRGAPAGPADAARLRAYLARRATREPAQYILGVAPFYGLDLRVRPGCLIPRPETELLAEAAIRHLATVAPPRFLEIGVGSGCLTAAILAHAPGSTAVATDRSGAALAIARGNFEALGCAGRVDLREDDLYTGDERFPLVVSNPPYIPTGDLAALEPELAFEPAAALDGGADGLAVIGRIFAALPGMLAPGGRLLLETGFDQAAGIAALAARHGLDLLAHAPDYAGHPRIATLRLPPPEVPR